MADTPRLTALGTPLKSNVINLRKNGCVQASATGENESTKPDRGSRQEGRFGSPMLKLMTLLSRGDFARTDQESPLLRGVPRKGRGVFFGLR